MPRVPFLFALLCLPLVVGCEGCRRDTSSPEEEQQAPLEDFTARPGQAYPSDLNPAAGGVKPGHWTTASQPLKSNNIDARGELLSRASATGARTRSGVAEDAVGEVPSLRPVVLPKGQLRRFDYRILTPLPQANDQKRAYLNSRFVSSGRSVFFDTGRQPFNILSGEEFFFVVLTDRPERFAKFQVSDWVRPFRDQSLEFQDTAANYRIVIPPTKDLLPLAETMLDWTNTAVLFWDDLSPDALTPQQQTAIADWVRFGGQLIVNGADASEAIAKTSLADLLPLKPTGNIELDPDSATALLQGWAVKTDPSTEKQIAVLRSQSGRVAVDGKAAPDTTALANSGDLVLIRRVGIGRVVQSRFDVTSDWMSDWKSYDSFINSALLARPHRQFVESDEAINFSLVQQTYPDQQTTVADPTMNSKFRIAARDAVLWMEESDPRTLASPSLSRVDPLVSVDSISGIGAWTDDSDAIRFSEQILRDESGIEIPKPSLVIRALGYYLLILVPVNYLVFRIINRLEYAWLAVPFIALAGAVWVARVARLDIGFARSQTEIALLELQPDYPRGHLSRVVAIYNSLSDNYDVEFKTVDAAAAPMFRYDRSADGPSGVFRTGFSEGPVLSGLAVSSNTVRLLHAEQIIDVGGSIRLDSDGQLINSTEHDLYDAIVIEKSASGEVRGAVIGLCGSGSATKLQLRPMESLPITDALPMQADQMMRRFASPGSMPNGSSRLVARVEGSLSGMTIRPEAIQSSSQTIVLAHLKHSPLPIPKVDANLIGDLRRVLTDEGIEGDPKALEEDQP